MFRRFHLRVYLPCLVGMIAWAGCASHGPQPQQTPASRLEAARSEIRSAKAHVSSAVNALAMVVTRPDENLQSQYDAFARSLRQLDEAAQRARDRALDLHTRRDRYVAQRTAELTAMPAGEQKESAETHLAIVQEFFNRVDEHFQEAREAFSPLIGHLRDANRFLSAELTPHNAASLADLLAQVRDEETRLYAALDAADMELDRFVSLVAHLQDAQDVAAGGRYTKNN